VDLADQTDVGLPRSNLVKKSSEPASVVSPGASAPVSASIPPPPASILAAQNPFAVANPFAVPRPFAAGNPFAASDVPPPALFSAAVRAPAPEVDLAPARESYRTKADSVEISVESQRAPETFREPPPPFAVQASAALTPATSESGRGQYSSSPSAEELLERAAALGPARMTWESIVLPADPILQEKRSAHVTERRTRLTHMVKIGLGACLGVCVLALGVSALSGDPSTTRATGAAASESIGKTVPSKAIIPVEPFDGTRHAKAVRRVAPAVTTAAIVRTKRR
jgi:hypothetical protein